MIKLICAMLWAIGLISLVFSGLIASGKLQKFLARASFIGMLPQVTLSFIKFVELSKLEYSVLSFVGGILATLNFVFVICCLILAFKGKLDK